MGYQNINAKDFEESIKNDPDAEVLDVRSAAEYAEGHLAGSKLIDIMSPDFRGQVNSLDKGKAFYIYCHSGVRSENACAFMAGMGFKKLFNLDSGIISWRGTIEK